MASHPDNRKVAFSVPQAKRLVDATRTVERATKDGVLVPANPADGRRLPNQTFTVRVTIDGGASGTTGSANCTWTYTVTSLRGNVTYGTTKTPEARRIPQQKYTSTPAGSVGLACFDEDGAFMLIWANETTDCT
jgi:hypothetical protein